MIGLSLQFFFCGGGGGGGFVTLISFYIIVAMCDLVHNVETIFHHMSRVMRKPTFCICENKDAEADQRLCFRYIDSQCSHSNFKLGVFIPPMYKICGY